MKTIAHIHLSLACACLLLVGVAFVLDFFGVYRALANLLAGIGALGLVATCCLLLVLLTYWLLGKALR